MMRNHRKGERNPIGNWKRICGASAKVEKKRGNGLLWITSYLKTAVT